MSDFLDVIAQDATETVSSGYYEKTSTAKSVPVSLKKAILQCKATPIISEVKGASPSKGTIRQTFAPEKVAGSMAIGGAAGISVLTEPKHFNGSLSNLAKIREVVDLPILMKDFVLSPIQLNAAEKTGANVVLLIQALFDRGHCSVDVHEMIAQAHSKNLEVLLETHSLDEFARAVETEADLVGINNRNLGTLTIDLNITKNILVKSAYNDKVVVSESGINSPADIRFLKSCGARAFLIGSAVMLADDVEAKVREFVNA